MKFFIAILCLSFNYTLFAQNNIDSVVFDSKLPLIDGIYTRYEELLFNAPRLAGAELEFEKNIKTIDWDKLYYFTKSNTRLKYEYPLFATVVNGHLAIYFNNQMNSVFMRGALCTFIVQEMVTQTHTSSPDLSGMGGGTYTTSSLEVNVYFLDLKTGTILQVDKDNLDPIIQRDSTLYSTFKKIKSDSNHKKSYPYISQYNERNKFYIKFIAVPKEDEE